MTLHQLFALCTLLLTACEDANDQRIEAYKKCQAAGMDTTEGINGYGSIILYCKVPRAKP